MKYFHSAIDHNNNKQGSLLFGVSKDYEKKALVKDSNEFQFIDLFAGIGGFRIALESLGAKCVFSSEWDKYAQKTYKENFGELPHGDINEVDTKSIPNFEILTAGFPCQPFSNIGMREGFGHKTQGNLFFNILDILKTKKPINFILENVGGLLSHKSKNVKTIDVIFSSLENLGYEVHYKLIDSADFGVPQSRKRIFIVGFLKKYFDRHTNFKFPENKKTKVGIGNFVESHKKGYSISKHLQKKYIFKKKDGLPQIVDKKSDIQVKTLVSTYHKIQRITGTFVKDGETGLRLLSENECKAIMGFPKNFKVPVSRTQMYRQFGNSVVIPVVKLVANEVIKVLSQANIIYDKKIKKSA